MDPSPQNTPPIRPGTNQPNPPNQDNSLLLQLPTELLLQILESIYEATQIHIVSDGKRLDHIICPEPDPLRQETVLDDASYHECRCLGSALPTPHKKAIACATLKKRREKALDGRSHDRLPALHVVCTALAQLSLPLMYSKVTFVMPNTRLFTRFTTAVPPRHLGLIRTLHLFIWRNYSRVRRTKDRMGSFSCAWRDRQFRTERERVLRHLATRMTGPTTLVLVSLSIGGESDLRRTDYSALCDSAWENADALAAVLEAGDRESKFEVFAVPAVSVVWRQMLINRIPWRTVRQARTLMMGAAPVNLGSELDEPPVLPRGWKWAWWRDETSW